MEGVFSKLKELKERLVGRRRDGDPESERPRRSSEDGQRGADSEDSQLGRHSGDGQGERSLDGREEQLHPKDQPQGHGQEDSQGEQRPEGSQGGQRPEDGQGGQQPEDSQREQRPEDSQRAQRPEDGIERATAPPGSPAWYALAGDVLSRCGEQARVVVDCLTLREAADSYAHGFVLSVRLGHVHRAAALRRAPLLEALQTACAGCRVVPDAPPLRVISCALSGSELERFSDLKVSQRGTSDLDVMHELGPVRCRLAEDRWPDAAPPPATEDSSAGPLLTVEPSNSTGFVLVRSAALGGSLVSAARVRRLIYAAVLLDSAAGTRIGCSGPAAAVSPPRDQTPDGVDNVPCLRLRQWPSEEFFRRRRTQDWPPLAARRDIHRFGVHLVPVGPKRGDGDQLDVLCALHEWRLSFSRAEVVAAWHLADLFRAALKAVKNAKNLLGADAKGLKSYYVKTVVFWMREQFSADQWQNVTEAALVVLERLDAAAEAGTLACYFWSEIDLFRFVSAAELEDLRRTVALLRAQLVPLLTVWSAYFCPPALRPLLEEDVTGPAPAPLSEREVRTRLARGLIVWGVTSSLQFRAEAPVHVSWCSGRVPDLLRRGALPELHGLLHAMTGRHRLPQYLLTALLVAPDALLAGARVTPLSGGLLAWDAAPLLALLTDADLRRLLVDPEAVDAWCRRQLLLPPAQRAVGLSRPLDTPRGLADLLLRPELLARALAESVPGWTEATRQDDEKRQRMWSRSALKLETFSDLRTALEQLLEADLEERLHTRPAAAAAAADDDTAVAEMAAGLAEDLTAASPSAVSQLWREAVRRELADPGLQQRAELIGTTLHDPWELRQYIVTEPPLGDRHEVTDDDVTTGGEDDVTSGAGDYGPGCSGQIDGLTEVE